MRRTALIKTPSRYHADRRDHAAQFERWLGYSLHPDARRAVAILERQRARRQPQRLYVCDRDASRGVMQRALASYVRWLAMVVRPETAFYVVGRNRDQVKSLITKADIRRLPDPKYQPILGTARSPEYCRGLNFGMALLLDSDAYPRRGRHLKRVWSSVCPCISPMAGTLAVIHGTYRPRTRVNHFTSEVRRLRGPDTADGLGPPLWPVLMLEDPPEPREADGFDITEITLSDNPHGSPQAREPLETQLPDSEAFL